MSELVEGYARVTMHNKGLLTLQMCVSNISPDYSWLFVTQWSWGRSTKQSSIFHHIKQLHSTWFMICCPIRWAFIDFINDDKWHNKTLGTSHYLWLRGARSNDFFTENIFAAYTAHEEKNEEKNSGLLNIAWKNFDAYILLHTNLPCQDKA